MFLAWSICATGVAATVVGGGGSAATDCLLVLDANVNVPLARPRHVRCVDGDPACDADATVNGVCRIPIAVCANSTFNPACTLAGVQSVTVAHALDNGDSRFDPDFQALQSRVDNQVGPPTTVADLCATPTNISVPIRGPLDGRCAKGAKTLRITSVSSLLGGHVYTDKDAMKLTCVPSAASGCDPTVLFAGTFDRIQRQVFTPTCAVSGCHDSQAMAAGMLLEVGAAYNNIVDATPGNPSAASAGWLRVDATNAQAATSYLYHKITGDLAPGFGGTMPLGRAHVKSALIEVIRLWIEDGAPSTGWVPGTDR